MIVSSKLPLPASGPTNRGSGAAWFFELRRLQTALRREIDVVAQLLLEIDERAVALERDLDEVERREVEPVGGAPAKSAGNRPSVGVRPITGAISVEILAEAR